MSATTISWTQHTINPIRARLRDAAHAGLTKGGYDSGIGHYCELYGRDCLNCYASHMQPRFGLPLFPGKQKRTAIEVLQNATDDTVAVSDKIELFFDDSKLHEVLKRKKPTKYFWCDMTDMFGAWVPNAWLNKCFATMAMTPWHTHQLLTKRTERVPEYLLQVDRHNEVELAAAEIMRGPETLGGRHMLAQFPLQNVHIGGSAGYQQAADERLPHLEPLASAGWTTWASFEPLIEDVRIPMRCWLDWAVVGAESGNGRRPMQEQWARNLKLDCEASGVKFFMKQMEVEGDVTEDIAAFPLDLQLREYPETMNGVSNAK